MIMFFETGGVDFIGLNIDRNPVGAAIFVVTIDGSYILHTRV